MAQKKYGVVAVGNAIVDILANATDEFLTEEGIEKGAMTLIDEERAAYLYSKMGSAVESSGGSAGNTMAGFGSFGGKGGYIAKVSEDKLGEIFTHDIRAQGIDFDTAPATEGLATACCYIFVTDDAQRSMNTFLGVSTEFNEDDVNEEMIKDADILYLEGYLFDKPAAKAAYKKASAIARSSGAKVAMTLSDTFCVERHRKEFLELVKNDVDVLFANEAEIKALFETDDFDSALEQIEQYVDLVAVTRSEKGAVVMQDKERIVVPAAHVEKIVDTTGAGDQFAAGFLYGLSENMDLETCGQLGCQAAAEVISHFGPRPEKSYSVFLEEEFKQAQCG